VLRALGADGQPAPPENQGFLRRDALLAIIMVTDEDDCSARAGEKLYDTSANMYLSSPLGPPANFRCNEFGHVCNGVRPPRQAPNGSTGDTVTLENCASSECDGALTPVGEFVARIRALKVSPASEIVMAAIAGPPAPYQVHWTDATTPDTSCGQSACPWPEISHSCTSSDGSFADPGVRVAQAVAAFGANGFASSICDPSFAAALQHAAARIGALLAAGGGTGGVPGSIPTCAAPGGAGGAPGGAGGGVDGGRGGAGGTTGAAATTGADAPGDDGNHPLPGRDGCGCQTGGPALRGGSVAGAVIALLARRRRRGSVGPGL
jgi:hypothetical protein